jgi:multiple sugar transport system permease protein
LIRRKRDPDNSAGTQVFVALVQKEGICSSFEPLRNGLREAIMGDTQVVQTASAAVRVLPGLRARRRFWRGELQGSEYAWALAFVIPYVAVFLVFAVYPVLYEVWMGSDLRLYTEVFDDPIYQRSLVNTVLFVAIAVNVKLFLALLLSGFFMRPGWWTKALLTAFMLPWAVPAVPIFIAMHWMLNGDYGLLNNALWTFFDINGPYWLDSRWLAFGSAIVCYVWKAMPFWTLTFIAARASIPQEIHDAAKVDGATGVQTFVHINFPMLANFYFVCTLLSTIFAVGEYNVFYFITGGGPTNSTYVLATLAIRDGFDLAQPRLGEAVMMTVLPLLIPLVLLVLRRRKTAPVEL